MSDHPAAPSWVEVDLAAVRHNLRALAALLGPRCDAWAVVKADAYGHGAAPVARAALEGGALGLAVASLEEALALREAGLQAPVLLLSAGEPHRAEEVVRRDLIQAACEPAMVEALSAAAVALGRPARVHLKLDTGMSRLGVPAEEAAAFAQSHLSRPGLQMEGVFSHLATAEDPDPSFAWEQMRRLEDALVQLRAAGLDPGMRHLANSAAALRFPAMRLDAVRVGLLVYGLTPDAPELAPLDLRPALTWRTRLAFVREAPAGASVSYGRTFVTRRPSRLAVLPLGYADGYPRQASNRAHVLVRGTPCPVVGMVCMDHVIVDITDAPGARMGDEAVLIGRQGRSRVTANHLARWAGTVVHACTTAIGRRVARVYCDEGRPLDPGLGPER